MLLVHQHISIPRVPLVHIHHSLIRLLHRPLLNPRLHLLLHRQLQHLRNLMRRPNRTSPNLAALRNQAECVEARQLILRRSNLDELPIGAQQHQILLQWHIGRRNSADDQIERAGMVRRPVFVLVGSNELLRAHLLRILPLGIRSRDHGHLISSQRFGIQDAKMAEATKANDPDFLARTAAVLFQRGKNRDAAAKHRRRSFRGDAIRDLEHEVRRHAGVVGVAAIGLVATGVFAIVGGDHTVRAVVLHPLGALLAIRTEAGG